MSHEEKANGANGHMEVDRNRLTQTVTFTPEQFEKLYLSPKTEQKYDLRKTFGNPTPL